MWALKIVEFDVPDCIEPYNYVPIYIWCGVLAALIMAAVIIACTYIVSTNKKQRRLAEIRNANTCPTCSTVWSGGLK